jgi:lysophospholipase
MKISGMVTQEHKFSDCDVNNIEDFWARGVFLSFQGAKNTTIEYAYFIKDNALPTIVISSGRSEGYLKYKETIFDLYHNDYNIFIMDHRGQGLSQRALNNRHKGYVECFDLYADDLYKFITTIVSTHCKSLPYLLCHSMGCAIAARMFQLYPQVVKSAVLLSPMIAINSGGIPYSIASGIITIGHTLNEVLNSEPWYFLGQTNYEATPFSKNKLTHSQYRYNQFMDLYDQEQEIQLGGVTFHWLKQAIANENKLFDEIDKITTPLVVIQAGSDSVVDNNKQNAFCSNLNQVSADLCDSQPIKISGSYHEMLFESDPIRNQTFAYIFEKFTSEQPT